MGPGSTGLICGLTLGSTEAHIARAALESVAYQTFDLAHAMREDGAMQAQTLRIDGGMAANDWFSQFLANILDTKVQRPSDLETTALGAAFLAGLATGVWSSLEEIATIWKQERLFEPKIEAGLRLDLLRGWQDAVRRTLTPH